MQTRDFLPAFSGRILRRASAAILFSLLAAVSQAASIRGVVTDASGAKVRGAGVALVSKGKVVASAISSSDGSFELTTGSGGHFFLVVTASSFRQLQTPDFYAGAFDSVERNLVLEPAWVHESIVVTDTGTPTPQPQTSSSTTVLSPLDLAQRTDLVSVLRLMAGTQVVQEGQMGAQTSLFVRGGDSDDNKTLLDGIDVSDLGNQFNYGQFSTTGVEDVEVYRGPDSTLFGAGAMTSVVSATTPHGTTSFPSLLFEGDTGNLSTSREQLQAAGTHKKLDYLGAFSWLQTANDLPNDEYHLATTVANVGWALNGSTQLRGTLHYGVDATGVPNAWDFYHVADDATEKDQDIFLSAALDNQTTARIHNDVRYGLVRKREQYHQWQPEGLCLPVNTCDAPVTYAGGNYFGQPVTIAGANGYSASGQALLDYSQANGSVYPSESQLVNNRDQLIYRGDMAFTPHLNGLIGFQYEDERGADPQGFYPSVDRTNYDYQASVHGDFRTRFFYTLGGSLEHYSLYGVETLPRAGFSVYALKPRHGVFSSTRILFNFGDAVREPTLADQEESLFVFLGDNGGQSTIQSLHIGPLTAPAVRTYEGGAEQTFLSQHIVLRASYFHNQFGRGIEYVGYQLVPYLLPSLTAAQQTQLEDTLISDNAYDLTLNSSAFRAQGFETTVASGIGRNLLLRGGYTYLDAVVQRSFSSDNQTLIGVPSIEFDGILLGAYSPLVGARPFRRAPHTGYFTATYTDKRFTGVFTSAFASRSDDSTYLENSDAFGGNSLLLPNRNLDHGYAKLDLSQSFEIFSWVDFYTQAENLMNNQHIAPIGYPSLPFTVRTGLRLRWGPGSGRH